MRRDGKLSRVPLRAYLLLALSFALQIGFWSQTHQIKLPVSGAGPAPTVAMARVLGLGDAQFYYRAGGFWLQNSGDGGGGYLPLRDLNYDHLRQWFELLLKTDARADYVPVLAGFYFGNTPEPQQARTVALFLRDVARRDPARHWRWLAHAIYLARHRAGDMDLALEFANELAALPGADLPVWTRQMNAFILAKVGEREAARDILEALLASDPNIDPAEQRFMRQYIDKNLRPEAPRR